MGSTPNRAKKANLIHYTVETMNAEIKQRLKKAGRH